jgi:VanZ family protein
VLFSPDPGGPSVFAGSDKIVHVALFALLAGTARWRFEAARAVLPAVLAYAALSEIVQWLALAERSGDVLDLLADTAGALVGWYFAGRRLTRRP